MSAVVLAPDAARVFFDGIFTHPKLSHPEGVAIGPDGWIWAGNENGQILRIAPDGSDFEVVATTGGFALGLAFQGTRALFVCDLEHAAVFRLNLKSGQLDRWEAAGMRIPNYPLVDKKRGRLLVSDSHMPGEPGPGIFAFNLESGASDLWCGSSFNFANGLAMRLDEEAVYVCETFGHAIKRVPILPDGCAGEPEDFVGDLPGLPDGIAFDEQGALVVGCYEPSRLLRIAPDGNEVDILAEDRTAHTLCHPTNIAFDGKRLFTANLGRWHLTEVKMDVGARPLWERSA